MKRTLNIESKPVIRLSEVEKLIKRHRIITPAPSRKTLQRMCEDGTFDAVGNAPTKFGWLVYEDSFLRWIDSLDGRKNETAA